MLIIGVPTTQTINGSGLTYFVSAGITFVFSVDEVFSYSVVERRGMMPLVPLTVRFPLVGSYLAVVRGLAGLFSAARKTGKQLKNILYTISHNSSQDYMCLLW